VNPTDWKSRRKTPPGPEGQVPNQDGAGTIEAVGRGVDPVLVGERVWIWEAAWQRPFGTAAEYTVVPARPTVLLGARASFELGAALGIPFLTAHRCLTVAESLPDRVGPGSLDGRTVLVQGGAGAVGNAAIQLARWADATVIATVSSPAKAQLAAAAGADHVVDYRRQDVVAEVRRVAPKGVDAIVEVSAAVNSAVDAQVIGLHGAVAMYADDGGAEVTIPVRLSDDPERALAVRARLHRARAGEGDRRRGRERRRAGRRDPRRPGGGSPAARLPAAPDGRRSPGGAGRRRGQGARRRHRLSPSA